MNILIIGGGLFGTVIAKTLSENKNNKITICELSNTLLSGASKNNHNRVHLGFHYPRSVETALQSLDGLASFFINFKDAIFTKFKSYYMIAKDDSKVSPEEYIEFCDIINVFYKEEFPTIDINKQKIIASFLTEEPVFDFNIMKNIILTKITNKENIEIQLNKEIKTIEDCKNFDVVINTTYSNINKIHNIFNVNNINLRLQDVFIPIIELNNEPVGLTILDGNFCSIMPLGFEKNKFLLYHVRESVIDEQVGFVYIDKKNVIDYNNLINKSKEYYSFLERCTYLDSYRSVRALPVNDNDERLTECFIDEIQNTKLITVVAGKVSTCWSTAYKIRKMLNK